MGKYDDFLCRHKCYHYADFTIAVNIGGFLGLVYLFRGLAAKEADELDDGRVIDEESKEQGHLC